MVEILEGKPSPRIQFDFNNIAAGAFLVYCESKSLSVEHSLKRDAGTGHARSIQCPCLPVTVQQKLEVARRKDDQPQLRWTLYE